MTSVYDFGQLRNRVEELERKIEWLMTNAQSEPKPNFCSVCGNGAIGGGCICPKTDCPIKAKYG